MASVRKRDPNDPTSPWIVEYTDAAGKRRRKTPKTGLKKDAEFLRRQIESELDRGEHTAARASMKVDDVCDLYYAGLKPKRDLGIIGDGYLYGVEKAIRLDIKPFLGGKLMSELTVADVVRFSAALVEDRGLSERTANERREVFKRIEEWAEQMGFTKRILTPKARKLYRLSTRSKVKFPTKDEIALIFAACAAGKRCKHGERGGLMRRLYVQLAACCGLRFGEICALRREDIDLTRRIVRIRQNLTHFNRIKGPKTEAGIRDVPLPRHVVPDVKEWLRGFHIGNARDLLFTTRLGSQVKYANFHDDHWEPMLRDVGLYVASRKDRIHFHSLRHFAGSWWLANGITLPVVSKMMGHANAKITLEVYTHALSDADEDLASIDRVSALLSSVPQERPDATSRPARRDENATSAATA